MTDKPPPTKRQCAIVSSTEGITLPAGYWEVGKRLRCSLCVRMSATTDQRRGSVR